MADNFGIYNIAAQLETLVSSALPGTRSLDAILSSSRLIGTFLHEDVSASAPSWTQNQIGLHHEYVLPDISSSQHELTSLNSYLSGVENLENTAVPATAPLYYSKRQRFVKLTYALTASANLPVIPALDQFPATDEYASRSLFIPISGSYRNNTIFNPSIFEVRVPDRGKIRDLKVWVEFIHDHRGGPGTGSYGGNHFLAGGSGSTTEYTKQGLQGVAVALRSPNVDFKYAHPLWNNDTVGNFEKWPTSEVNQFYRNVPELMRGSYLLWSGHACEEDLGYSLGSHTGSVVNGDFTIRNITSSSFGPGISGSSFSDANYAILSTFGAYRTLSAISVNGTDPIVAYPTVTGSTGIDDIAGVLKFSALTFVPVAGTQPHTTDQHMITLSDSSTLTDALPFFTASQLIFHTASYAFYGPVAVVGPYNIYEGPLKLNSPRIRIQRNSPYMHMACLSPGTGIIYGIKQIGDGNVFPWRTKFPIITSGSDEFSPPISADSFYDFALDSHGKPHFVMNGWRGDLGIQELKYCFFSGSTANYENTPVGATFYTHASDGIFPKKHDYYTRALSGDELFPDLMTGILDNPLLVQDVDLNSPPGSVGAYCKIDIDKDDRIHVVYADIDNHSVKYATKKVDYAPWSGSWHFTQIYKHPIATTYPTYITMDVDGQNQPHVAYSLYDGSAYNIYYAKSGSTGWSLEHVSAIPGLQIGTKLKLDNNDVPYITSTVSNFDGNGNEGVILFRSSSDTGWGYKPLYKNSFDDPRDTSIAFVSTNKVRIYSGGGRLAAMWESFTPTEGKYFEYDTDIDMRTVFTDSSLNKNPRDRSLLYKNATQLTPGNSEQPGSLILDAHSYPSPFSASVNMIETAGVWGSSTSHQFAPILEQTTHLTGANVPWMFDSRVPPGIFHGLNYFSVVSSTLGLSPPPGWITGPGGAAAVNEFPTTGSNLGPKDIRPVYPLLDDVYVEKIFDQPSLTSNSAPLASQHNKIIGFRPGLRGTEINGIWRLLVGVAGDVKNGIVTGSARAGVWFRQVRLEFLVDTGEDSKETYASKSFRFRKPGTPQRDGLGRISIVSGSSAWDVGINYVYTNPGPQYGRFFGITANTGTVDFAVFSQLTGALVDALSGSGDLQNVRNSYLSNEFGTPYVPISSGSSAIPSFDTFDVTSATESKDIFSTTLNPKTLIPSDSTLRAHMTRAAVLKTTRDVILQKINLLKS